RLVVSSFGVQMQVVGGEQRREPVRIFEVRAAAAGERRPDAILTRLAANLRDKQSLLVLPYHRHALIRQNDFGGLGVRQKRAHFPAGRGAGALNAVRAQHLEWVAMVAAHNRFHLCDGHNEESNAYLTLTAKGGVALTPGGLDRTGDTGGA